MTFADLSASSQKYVLFSFLSSQKATSLSFLKWPSSLASKPLYTLFLLQEHFSSSFSSLLYLNSDASYSGKPSLTAQAGSGTSPSPPQNSHHPVLPALSHRRLCMDLSPPLNCESRREDPRMSQSHLCPQPSGAVAWGIAVEKKSSFRVKAAWEVLYSTLPDSSTLGMTLGKLPNLPESLIYKMVKQFLLNSVGNCIWN